MAKEAERPTAGQGKEAKEAKKAKKANAAGGQKGDNGKYQEVSKEKDHRNSWNEMRQKKHVLFGIFRCVGALFRGEDRYVEVSRSNSHVS